ncbi:hypothetical protein ABVK25_000248 [Lepraria finkii]|uniref:Uncharacterized protein n=1 Tax=Lepraria finkii TaxID=1340010 RepID=A0ABR4BPK2_9LECA
MASTDSTIPDTSTGDSTGAQAGQSFTDKAKSVVKGNIPTVGNMKPEDTANKGTNDVDDTGKESSSGFEQNKLL